MSDAKWYVTGHDEHDNVLLQTWHTSKGSAQIEVQAWVSRLRKGTAHRVVVTAPAPEPSFEVRLSNVCELTRDWSGERPRASRSPRMTNKLSAKKLERTRALIEQVKGRYGTVEIDANFVLSLLAEAERMREALEAAARAFRLYEKHHRAKGTEESNQKAAVNAEYAEMCERAALKEQP